MRGIDLADRLKCAREHHGCDSAMSSGGSLRRMGFWGELRISRCVSGSG